MCLSREENGEKNEEARQILKDAEEEVKKESQNILTDKDLDDYRKSVSKR